MVKYMNLITDRIVSQFLDTHSFIKFRCVCRIHYNDTEAWQLRESCQMFHTTMEHKQTIGLNHILGRSLQLITPCGPVGSTVWLQHIIEWIRHKISIQIIHSFLLNYYPSFLYSMNLSNLSLRQRLLWERLWCRNDKLYKTLNSEQYERPQKKRRILCY